MTLKERNQENFIMEIITWSALLLNHQQNQQKIMKVKEALLLWGQVMSG